MKINQSKKQMRGANLPPKEVRKRCWHVKLARVIPNKKINQYNLS